MNPGMKSKAFIGTSGYSYKHWGGVFYPGDVGPSRWLEYYARHFGSVELNVTFYRLPSMAVFKGWEKRTPGRFIFSIKGSRYITHIKRLKDCREPLSLFMRRASGLGKKLSVVLWQLHPKMKADAERLDAFFRILSRSAPARRARHAFEFRHESWFCEEIYALLEKRNHALCIAHSSSWPRVERATADFVYLRFHGCERLYGSLYRKGEMRAWAGRIRRWMGEGRDVYAYFNNDAHGFAVKNAMQLKELVCNAAPKPFPL